MKRTDCHTASIFVFLVLFFVLSPVLAKDEVLPERNHDGLVLYGAAKIDVVYVLPEADLSGYDKIMLLEAQIAFKKNWKRDQNRYRRMDSVNDKDMSRMISRGKDLFKHVFTDELEEGGYAVVTEPAENVLLVRPSIIDLDVATPDLKSPGRIKSYSASAGEATIFIELYDSVTGQILVRAFDRKVDRDTHIHWQMHRSSVTNTQDATHALKHWAGLLIKALDRAKKDHSEQN